MKGRGAITRLGSGYALLRRQPGRLKLVHRICPRLSRCRVVVPEDAGIGATPQSFAHATSANDGYRMVTAMATRKLGRPVYRKRVLT